jgi:hypothetical protein
LKYQITQEDAVAIKDKLQAEVEPKTKHDVVKFWHNGKIVVSFGIRRGSKELPHPHISLQMFISQKECRLFRQCTISVDEYLAIFKSKSKI